MSVIIEFINAKFTGRFDITFQVTVYVVYSELGNQASKLVMYAGKDFDCIAWMNNFHHESVFRWIRAPSGRKQSSYHCHSSLMSSNFSSRENSSPVRHVTLVAEWSDTTHDFRLTLSILVQTNSLFWWSLLQCLNFCISWREFLFNFTHIFVRYRSADWFLCISGN